MVVAGGNARRSVQSSNDEVSPPSLLAPVSLGSGRGGTAPYPNDAGSRPISASDGWMAGQEGRGRGVEGAAWENRTDGSEGEERSQFPGRPLAGEAGGGRGVSESTCAGEAAGAPPGAHKPLVRVATGAGVVDPDLVVAASGVRTGPAAAV